MDDNAMEELGSKDYDEVRRVMDGLAVDETIAAMESHSSKIGDTAAHVLIRRNEHNTVAQALMSGGIKSAIGRVRATFVLNMRGSACNEDIEVYEHLLSDRSDDVVSNALFGLAFFPSPDSLPLLRAVASRVQENSKRLQVFDKAIQALEQGDPSIFSPNFRDRAGVWRAVSAK